MYFRKGSHGLDAISPAIGAVLLVLITVFLSILLAPLVYNLAQTEEIPGGVEVTFEESQDGGVDVRVLDVGTSDRLYIHTKHNQREVTSSGDTVPVYPGEGPITVLASQDGVNATAQMYEPRGGPDEPLAAIINGDSKEMPGQTYTLDASDSLGNIEKYHWDLDGDGDPEETGTTVSESWARPGIYNISLTVEDANGHTHTTTRQLINTHLVVGQDGTGNYKSIQPAVNNASEGWSIYVKNTGRYEERVEFNHSQMTVFSNQYATIDGEFVEGTDAGVSVTKSDVELRGLRVRGFSNGPAITVSQDSDNVVLDDLFIDENGNHDTDKGALHIEHQAGDTTISNSRILSNDGACAVVLGTDSANSSGPNVTIDNTSIRSSSQSGLCAYDSVTRLNLTNSEFTYNGGHGAYLGEGNKITVQDTVFHRNGIRPSSDAAAVFIHNSQDMLLESVNVSHNINSGLETAKAPVNITGRDSSFVANGGNGLTLAGVQDSQFTNITSRKNEGIGLSVLGTADNNNVNQSRLNANSENGLYIANQVRDLNIGETEIRKNSEHGVYLDRANSIYFKKSNFTENGGSEGEYYGVYLRGALGDTLENIVIRDSHLYGTNQSGADLVAYNAAKTIDARYNWWGSDEAPMSDQYRGDIDWDPLCADEDCRGVR